MSKLLAKLKAEAKNLKTKQEAREAGGFTKIKWFSPQKGSSIIRILPHWAKPGEELFYKEVKVHFNVPVTAKTGTVYKIPARCLRDFEETCPMCDAYEELIQDDSTKDQARNFRATDRYLYNILDYQTKEVKVYPAPVTVHQEVVYWANEVLEGGEDITDMNNGRNFKLVKSVDPSKPAQFGTSYDLKPDLKNTKVPAKLVELTDTLNNLDEIYSENHREAMEEFLGITDSVKEVKKYTSKVAPKTTTKTVTKAKFTRKPVESDPEEDFEDGSGIDLGVETDDDDLDAELRRLGVE